LSHPQMSGASIPERATTGNQPRRGRGANWQARRRGLERSPPPSLSARRGRGSEDLPQCGGQRRARSERSRCGGLPKLVGGVEQTLLFEQGAGAQRIRIDPFLDVVQHVDQRLGGAQIGTGRFFDRLRRTGSRLAISRRSPSMVTTTGSLSTAPSNTGRFFGRDQRGLPDWPFLKRLCSGGLPRPTS
jgi:hypothetical protein